MIRPAPSWLIDRPIAHRGLHNLQSGRAENSLGAFQAAVDAGYAIECDLQICASGEPVVFHDADLDRMTGIVGHVRDKQPDVLKNIKLLDTTDGIHLLDRHLELVAGKVPIVLELKGVGGEDTNDLVKGVANSVRGYDGPLAVMSFEHDLCAQFKDLLPHLPRGLTAEGSAETEELHTKAMHEFDLQFVSYRVGDLPVPFIDTMRRTGVPVITWTVRTTEQVNHSRKYADQMTFEGFLPPHNIHSPAS